MSKRTVFTEAHALLIIHMIGNKDNPVSDFLKRSDDEQKRLFDKGLSRCDGKVKISKHQIGCAVDIYLIDQATGKLIDWATIPKKAAYYHEFWETLGGSKIIPWDLGHFEF